jgi:hypothetical protein
MVRLAESGAPQHVSVRGRPAVVVLAANGPFGRLDNFDDALVRERPVTRDPVDFQP